MVPKRCKPHAILALFITIIFHDAIAAGALPIELRYLQKSSNNVGKKERFSHQAQNQISAKQPPFAFSERATHAQKSVSRKRTLHIDVNAAERSHQTSRSLKATMYSADALPYSDSSANEAPRTSLIKRGGGKGMDRHLAAASFAAMLAVGTASMGVATYMLRLNDWKKYKKPAFKKGTKEIKKLEAQDKSGKGKNSKKGAKDDDDQPDSPASPSSPQNVFFITNNYNAPAEQAARQLTSGSKGEVKPCNASNASVEHSVDSTVNGTLPPISVHKRALLRPPSGSGISVARATSRVRVRPAHRTARQVRHRQAARAAQPSTTTAEASAAPHRPESTLTAAPDDSGPPTVSRGLINLKKVDKWAPLAAKIEDYGKVSAATGAFLAGAVSLYTSASEHHEYRKLDKDGNGIKDDDEDKNGNGVRDGDEDEDNDKGSDDESEVKADKKANDKRSDEDALDAGRGCNSAGDNSTQHITITIH